ncbi:hypothetical protein Bbelb_340830 [Branchiostoma belcheri]|nr:hypothetical protein Bbelb_340830 [Branchiostoma belcheri]
MHVALKCIPRTPFGKCAHMYIGSWTADKSVATAGDQNEELEEICQPRSSTDGRSGHFLSDCRRDDAGGLTCKVNTELSRRTRKSASRDFNVTHLPRRLSLSTQLRASKQVGHLQLLHKANTNMYSHTSKTERNCRTVSRENTVVKRKPETTEQIQEKTPQPRGTTV